MVGDRFGTSVLDDRRRTQSTMHGSKEVFDACVAFVIAEGDVEDGAERLVPESRVRPHEKALRQPGEGASVAAGIPDRALSDHEVAQECISFLIEHHGVRRHRTMYDIVAVRVSERRTDLVEDPKHHRRFETAGRQALFE